MNGIILGTIGLWQFVIIALVIVLLFGSAKIPELMRNLGKGIGEFKKSTKGEDKSEAVKKDEKQPFGQGGFSALYFLWFFPAAGCCGRVFISGRIDRCGVFSVTPFLEC